MARYVPVRALLGAITIAGVVLATFALQFLTPGDPARRVAGPRASPETLAVVRDNLRLDEPVATQLAAYVGNVAQGDLGVSYVKRRPVIDMLLERLPATALLAGAGLVIEVVLGYLLGMRDGLRGRRSRLLAGGNVLLLSTPTYTLAFLLLVLFGFWLDLVPVDGGQSLSRLILPAVALGLFGVPYYTAVVSEAVRDAVSSPWARTAIAKGLPPRRILRRPVLRASISPVLTLLGLDAAIYLSGTVFVESVYGWPGIGQLQQDAFDSLDRPVLMGTIILGSVAVVAFNLLADVARALVDPRARTDAT